MLVYINMHLLKTSSETVLLCSSYLFVGVSTPFPGFAASLYTLRLGDVSVSRVTILHCFLPHLSLPRRPGLCERGWIPGNLWHQTWPVRGVRVQRLERCRRAWCAESKNHCKLWVDLPSGSSRGKGAAMKTTIWKWQPHFLKAPHLKACQQEGQCCIRLLCSAPPVLPLRVFLGLSALPASKDHD